jgi:hypothetical protein
MSEKLITLDRRTLNEARQILDQQWQHNYETLYVSDGSDFLSLDEYRRSFCLSMLGYLDHFINATKLTGEVDPVELAQKLRQEQEDRFNQVEFDKTSAEITKYNGDLLQVVHANFSVVA